MDASYPRIGISGPTRARELIRIVFFIPQDHVDIAAGVSHALERYLSAVQAYPAARAVYTCCYWEPGKLDDRGWALIQEALMPKVRGFIEDDTTDGALDREKAGADPYFSIAARDDSGFYFGYHARLPSRQPPPGSVSVLRVTLPIEFLEEHGQGVVRALAVDMASQLPFASGHAGFALSTVPSVEEQLDRLGPFIFRHPGFDIRDASIHDFLGTRIDGVHWLNFLGPPVLGLLGGVEVLQLQLPAPSSVQSLDDQRAVISLGPGPEAGDLTRGQHLPAYRMLAKVLEPFVEPFPWRCLPFTNASTEQDLRRWWRRFLD